MADEVRIAAAFAVALGLTWLAVPLAIRVARRTEFFDHPEGYKGHSSATPYLGGAALIAGFVPVAMWLGDGLGDLAPIVGCALALLIVGTIDDRIAVPPVFRVAVEVAAGAVLYATGLGFTALENDVADLVLTVLFVVGVVNAYNLIDNIDGAAATVAATSAVVLGIACAILGDVALGALSVGLAGSCVGFLPRNLSRPARIFLGDGGSMAMGVIIAAVIMSLPGTGGLGWAIVPVTAVLVGIPALDTFLVIVSRIRRRAAVHRGARDHLTHRLLAKLGSTWRVALVLAVAQSALVCAGALLSQGSRAAALAGSGVIILAGLGVVASFEWLRPGVPAGSTPAQETTAYG